MPYRTEGSLFTWRQRRTRSAQTGELSLKRVAHLIGQAASALQYTQIIHRDVKPANFLIREKITTDEFPELLLADFGIARLGNATTTCSQVIRGAPAYMALEQWVAQAAPASDQYALAIMTYQLLTRSLPLNARTPNSCMLICTNRRYRPASAIRICLLPSTRPCLKP